MTTILTGGDRMVPKMSKSKTRVVLCKITLGQYRTIKRGIDAGTLSWPNGDDADMPIEEEMRLHVLGIVFRGDEPGKKEIRQALDGGAWRVASFLRDADKPDVLVVELS
jgi:hypothetical protein